MLIENKKLYEALEKALKGSCSSKGYAFVHAIYEPDYDGGPYDGLYHAAADICEEGETYHVYFAVKNDNSVWIENIERWFFG